VTSRAARFLALLCAASALPALVSLPASAQPSEHPPEPDEVNVLIHGQGTDRPRDAVGRAASQVDRTELEERLPRSAPDALRYEPGVYVQQSAHGQGSPYVRGRTGQHTVVLFDGIRMNTSTWRQGPNQYFFTVDSKTIDHIVVTRGGGSTLHGSDAIAGVIDAHPIEPRLSLGAPGPLVRPRTTVRWASADNDFSERFQVDTQVDERLRFVVGAGMRAAGRLEGGGVVRNPLDGNVPQVPRLEDDGRTQLGTGFKELTGDARFVYGLASGRRLVAAAYAFRQFDSPRTDQCPAAFAPRDECLKLDEQFRSLVYVSHEGQLGRAAEQSQISLSYQRQHERRLLERPSSYAVNGGRDDVNTFGLTAKVTSAAIGLFPNGEVVVRYGGDAFYDTVESSGWTELRDIGAVQPSPRGQYLAGSRYAQGGVFGETEWTLARWLTLRGGARLAGAKANAPADEESGTVAVDAAFHAVVGHAGATTRVADELSLTAAYDRSFRAPNLDDLTSRQQTGPGFQFENPGLRPETADSFELGVQVSHPRLEVDGWAYRSVLRDAITRAFRSSADCPPETPQCQLSWQRYQLVNVEGDATIDGAELSFRARLRPTVRLLGTVAYAFGEGPNPAERPSDSRLSYEDRVPLSRVPPLNGTLDVRWSPSPPTYFGAALRWARLQDRLAPTDLNDARIPLGGTPGYAVFDLRAGWRMQRRLVFAAVLENLFDSAYRVHGSSVNGPGRGVSLSLEAGL
jgi:iron complex outermembrane receptor protein/hemoglobin/transferrin/lactoferrin receptor protein